MKTSGDEEKSWWQRSWVKWLGGSVVVLLLVLLAVGEYLVHHAAPIVKHRMEAMLSRQFHTQVQLDTLDISLVRGIEVTGGGLRIPYNDEANEVVSGPPHTLIGIDHFAFHTTWAALIRPTRHIGLIKIDGILIDLPPGDERKKAFPKKDPSLEHKAPPAIVVDKILCTNARLIIENKHPEKEPKEWDITTLTLENVTPDEPMSYEALLTNPVPKGEIHSQGKVGPWNTEDPRQTPIEGSYTFSHADMNTIKGIGGHMDSVGKYTGVLEEMTVDGTANVPDFSLDISDHAVPLKTVFHAYVDGTSGDTTLDPVHAVLGETPILCKGSIVNLKGKGHDIALDAEIEKGSMSDVLTLAMKSDRPILKGQLSMKSHIHIPPGQVSVAQKLELQGELQIDNMTLTDPKTQDQMDSLSMRAQGKPQDVPKAATDKAVDVVAQVRTKFNLSHGKMLFPNVTYEMPGAHVRLQGVYEMNGNVFEFKGLVRTDATASQMVSGWKSWMLKPVDPFLKKDGAGVQLPIQITGVKSDIHVGLAPKHSDDSATEIQKDLSAKRAAGAINLHPKQKTEAEKAKDREKSQKNYQKLKQKAQAQ